MAKVSEHESIQSSEEEYDSDTDSESESISDILKDLRLSVKQQQKTMKQLGEKQDKLGRKFDTKMTEMEKQLNHLEEGFEIKFNEHSESIRNVHGDVTKVKTEQVKLQEAYEKKATTLRSVQEKVNDLERHSRKYNLRLVGVPESEGEDTEQLVQGVLRDDLKMDYSNGTPHKKGYSSWKRHATHTAYNFQANELWRQDKHSKRKTWSIKG